MHKKLIMACMAIAAFAAFVVAPAASASPVLTSGGTLVPAGTSITGKNTGNTLFTGGFAVTCSTAHLTGTLNTNSGTTIKGEVPVGSASFTGTGSGGDCTSALGDVRVTVNSALCIHASNANDNVAVTGCGGNITFTLHITNSLSCAYSTASVTGTYKTGEAATVNISAEPANRESGQNIFCPSTGSLTMDFDLYTTDGTLLQVS